MEQTQPSIAWVKNDPSKHQIFEDGSRFLVAIKLTHETTGVKRWDYDVVTVSCDEDFFDLTNSEGESCGWNWEDFDFFHVLEGPPPWPRERKKPAAAL